MADRVNGCSADGNDHHQCGPTPPAVSASNACARSLAARFRRERERQGLTLQNISSSTKVSPRFLTAIEKADFDELPGGILAKGFIRAYARCIGIDEEEAIADYLEASGLQPEPTPGNEESRGAGTQSRNGPENQVARAIFAVVLLIVSIGVFTLVHYKREVRGQTDPAPHASVPPLPRAAEETETQPPQGDTDPSTEREDPYQTPGASLGELPGSQPAYPSSTQTSLMPGTECTTGVFCIQINAREDAWVSINADGNVIFQRTLVARTTKLITARRRVVIRAGNIGALDFVFNGHGLPPQGNYDEARTLSFSTEGLERVMPRKLAVTPAE
jgi:cytoskeleton protein RodZ